MKTTIKRSTYALAVVDGSHAELTMYGDIYREHPRDWWTNEPVEGNFITLEDFLEDLKEIEGCRTLTIRIDSYGGSAHVSNTIHNRLRELQRGGMEVTCIVDGVAMSGGSLIMCACNNVEVNPSSLIMIHNCWTIMYGGYNSLELRKTAEELDATDQMQATIYARKTGLSKEEILAMMAETTYMTGQEAVDKGFADKLLDDAEPLDIAASADRRTLYVRNRSYHLAPGMTAPAALKIAEPPDAWASRMLEKFKQKEE